MEQTAVYLQRAAEAEARALSAADSPTKMAWQDIADLWRFLTIFAEFTYGSPEAKTRETGEMGSSPQATVSEVPTARVA